ncbi:hypothetical protein MPDQ_002430 [Monascus purpureus]|uniref:Glycosyl hydrolase n=1 Tax=Monascus purpureus TaxID=5098 RepID=A0A507QKI5_MONPU|nr:hypothetical protein MPDQ_002430 [Monascus purpureus]BDD59845.1 hypothetical protein MAP00_005029 [Monascus purpureus]
MAKMVFQTPVSQWNATIFLLCVLSFLLGIDALALLPRSLSTSSVRSPKPVFLLDESVTVFEEALPFDSPGLPADPPGSIGTILKELLYALNVMQDDYFELWQGTWPTSIDWTAAVLGTHVSATLSSLASTSESILASVLSPGDGNAGDELDSIMSRHVFEFENLLSHFFDHLASFYFGENAFGVRNQAYDDMLWVVLGWLENIKLQDLHSELRYTSGGRQAWHASQFRDPAAHRARLFYELASEGWNSFLCDGGMIWSPYLTPYKNAITNELYISASIAMYLYFPGDPIDSPFVLADASDEYPHNPAHLQAAIKGYRWLKNSRMIGRGGLYGDGFHISGWESADKPGTRRCDVLNTMVYTYNQGVILSGLRGLWLANGSQEYLYDGHELIQKVMKASGWPDIFNKGWMGLGRSGIIEEACDSHGSCSQDGQTFKGIFFHHLTEFCRPLRPQEERFLSSSPVSPFTTDDDTTGWQDGFNWHQSQCRTYRTWIEHNAKAALVSRDTDGKFGTWWGRPYRQFDPDGDDDIVNSSFLPPGAVDYRNDDEILEALRASNPPSRVSESGFRNTRQPGEKRAESQETWKHHPPTRNQKMETSPGDYNDRGRGRTVETQSGGVAVLRALYQWTML